MGRADAKPREIFPDDLPVGWRAFRTAESLIYYYHGATGFTRWSHPSEDASPCPSLSSAPSTRETSHPGSIGVAEQPTVRKDSGSGNIAVPADNGAVDRSASASTDSSTSDLSATDGHAVAPRKTSTARYLSCVLELVAPDLPTGWRAFRSADGYPYYYNSATGLTQWLHPGTR